MRVRMFKPQFALLVQAGTKRQTIRPMPKRMPKVGDKESWREWIGGAYRSKQRELVRVELTEIRRIKIMKGKAYLSGKKLSNPEYHDLAHQDGFLTAWHMGDWFKQTHRLPFHGILIRAK